MVPEAPQCAISLTHKHTHILVSPPWHCRAICRLLSTSVERAKSPCTTTFTFSRPRTCTPSISHREGNNVRLCVCVCIEVGGIFYFFLCVGVTVCSEGDTIEEVHTHRGGNVTSAGLLKWCNWEHDQRCSGWNAISQTN